jgi:hypothetical protein
MSLADFIAATQAEMKSRIEEECKKQMMALLEQSFSSKWEEYTSKTVESASAVPVYTKQYGKLTKETLGTGTDPNSAGYWNKSFTDIIYNQMNKITFTSRNVYFIHCCARFDNNSGHISANFFLVDNYGFAHQLSVTSNGAGYPDKPIVIDITKPSHGKPYIYPLTNALIDTIKAMPYAVVGTTYSSNQWGSTSFPGGDINGIISNLPQIRKAAEIFHEQATATEKLLSQKKAYEATLAENEALKARIAELEEKEKRLTEAEARLRAIEATSPTEDLLGLEALSMNEPSKD